MPRINTSLSKLEIANPMLAGLLSKEPTFLPQELQRASNRDLCLVPRVAASSQAPVISAPGPYDSVPEKGFGDLLESFGAKFQEQENIQQLIEFLCGSDDDLLLSNLEPLARELFNKPFYDNVPGVATINHRLLVLWLERNQLEECALDEVDPARVLNLVNCHPFKAAKLAENYGKTLALLEERALSGAHTASLQTPAITGGTARN